MVAMLRGCVFMKSPCASTRSQADVAAVHRDGRLAQSSRLSFRVWDVFLYGRPIALLSMRAAWKRPALLGLTRTWSPTAFEPALSPNSVTLRGLPPKLAMFACTHWRARI